jgi:hypothetical protein
VIECAFISFKIGVEKGGFDKFLIYSAGQVFFGQVLILRCCLGMKTKMVRVIKPPFLEE